MTDPVRGVDGPSASTAACTWVRTNSAPAALTTANCWATLQRPRVLNHDTLTRRRAVFGDDHPDTLASADNLARDLYHLGENRQARLLDEDTLRRRRGATEGGSPADQRLHETLRTVLRRLGGSDAAELSRPPCSLRSERARGPAEAGRFGA